MKDTKRIFTYGTLKRGYPLNSWLSDSEFVQEDTLKGRMYDLGPYPVFFQVDESEQKEITGEVFDMPLDSFKSLERMEGNVGYKTKVMTTGKGEEVHVFVHTAERYKVPENEITTY